MSKKDEHLEKSPDQVAALQEIADWMQGSALCMSLVGPAGSGKSFLTQEIVALARKRRWNVVLTAPTHKAAGELEKAARQSATTTHRSFGVKLKRNKRTGDEYLSGGSPAFKMQSLVIVDEASMVCQHLLEIVLKAAAKQFSKVLFIGDSAQLNPVNELASATVDKDQCDWQIAELTTIHRQAAENPIISAATMVRTGDPDTDFCFETAVNGDHGVVVIPDRREWADRLVHSCADQSAENRYVSYTNAAADAAAKAIRFAMFGDQASEPYLPGERLIVNSRCEIGGKIKKGKRVGATVIDNNAEITVKNVWLDGRYKVSFDWEGESLTVDAFASYTERELYLRKLANQQNWKDYFEEKDQIADLRSATAITTHKAQGSTFKDVYINLSDIAKCRDRVERQRLLYVALTRASRCVYLTGAL